MSYFKRLFVVTFLFSFVLSFGQEIEVKKGVISIDGKECMKYYSDAVSVTYQDLKGDDIIIFKYIRSNGPLYVKVIFLESNQELTTSYIFTKKDLIGKLVKCNAIKECALDEEKVRNFVLKFDEGIEKRSDNNSSTNTVIIKEEPQRSGVNINIGR